MTDERLKTGGGFEALSDAADPLVGECLGNYRLDEMLAEGGMGRVYRATRADGQFDRDVAVKVLPPGMGAEYVKRFRQESQILASLSHPNIAQLFDAGFSETGSPFLVMELIVGTPVNEFARDLDTKSKAKLMLALSEALAFAHARLVVHRDLKPSNVFVTVDGELKLLDFGIAKILEAPDSLTVANRPMTPRYASPEQLLNKPISVASDIYQFGLLFLSLFEQREDTRSQTPNSAIESAVLNRSVTVEDRLTEPIPAELAAIINQCLRVDPDERYASASAVASDIRNFLTGYPVAARNPGTVARGLKFLSRNWLSSSAVALTLVSLFAFLVLTLQQQATTEAARASAEREQQRAEEVTAFLIQLFESNNPSETLGEDPGARDILERALARIDELDQEPELKADLMDAITKVFLNLGDFDTALRISEETLSLKESLYAGQPIEIAETLELIARVYNWFGRLDEAFDVSRRVYEIRRSELGPDAEGT